MFIKITGGFAPDSPDITNPGVVLDCLNMYSTPRGMKAAPAEQQQAYAVQSIPWKGAAEVTMIDGSTRLFAATESTILELDKTTVTYTNRSRSVGGVYATGANRWDFAQQGNLTIATNKTDIPQVSTGAAFADGAATFPKCSFVESVGEFIHLAGTNEATNGDLKDGWWVSLDYTLWTPNVATQCFRGRIVDPPGPFTGLRRLRDDMIYYKQRSMLISRYANGTDGWIFDTVSVTAGAVSNESIVQVGDIHYFLGVNNFYAYDGGGEPQPIGDDLALWLFKTKIGRFYIHKCYGVYDPSKNIIIWYFANNAGISSVHYQFSLIYSLSTGKWGYGEPVFAEAACQYTEPSQKLIYPAVFGTATTSSTTYYTYLTIGTPANYNLTTGYFGDDANTTNLRSVRPRAATALAATTTLTPELYRSIGVQDAAISAISLANRKFDVLKTANWFRNKFSFTSASGEAELLGYTLDVVQAGK